MFAALWLFCKGEFFLFVYHSFNHSTSRSSLFIQGHLHIVQAVLHVQKNSNTSNLEIIESIFSRI